MENKCLIANFAEFLTAYGQCGRELIALSVLERELPSYRTRHFVYKSNDPDSKADLLLARVKIFDSSAIDLAETFVCQQHVEQISLWEPGRPRQCNLHHRHAPIEESEDAENGKAISKAMVSLPSTKAPAGDRYLSKSQSEALLLLEGHFYPVGTTVCRHCGKHANEMVEKLFHVSF